MKISPMYILPNLFTAGSIFLGVLSIMAASHGLFKMACWFILVSMVLDGLDGRVARLTNTSSKFGVEFDSLADVVAFGVAPAILLYFYIGDDLGRFGEATSALFVIFGAMRLARFNITTVSEPNFFIGLPIPSAAVFVVLWVLVDLEHKILLHHEYLLLLGAFIISILMVSNVRYPSFKKMQWNLKSFSVLLILLAITFIKPVEVLCVLMSGYVLYGLIRWSVLFVKILLKPDNRN
ncbi:MAG: CDP-diacylglycerol--serine O-phosphatidyltransferase [Helicobacter sp.]|uniref:CDP-diacylglycerol--serine O-phosphatidyltransferase n=1 Tax=Helicobacter sp. 10-6591 TaxID=2004998 RepID=UPI000DCB821D|nr:CDP-diacylglycerol--serine O-phosphatidyltransferase [Helicobacter sp. 10-6591]MCI7484527.1 CDP-diacylglycerol--serine O-phosphatidyltransferase [Helicobacter sp.]MDD7567095.1 CDP-diacylglycerol--serine O-phosphatidyltransferase [Helicobacter sp.]MDY5739976.1 CDP-diacylglycerol--serine O-phosphatidyltransferase [Helicobacter sp.]RAX55525.1 CDP-diacylglycerol--serine O-phosphatidyltransferase [Helicobacter sp. 10-6591]